MKKYTNWNLAKPGNYITCALNTLRPRQNGRRFPDDIFKYIFLNENVWILLKISLKFIHKFRINNIPALVQIMAWRRPGDKPLSEPMMGNSLTHICVTRPQWVKFYMQSLKDLTEKLTSGIPKMRKSHDQPLCAYLMRYDAHIQSHRWSWPKWH